MGDARNQKGAILNAQSEALHIYKTEILFSYLFSLVTIILLLPSSYRWLLRSRKDNYHGIIPVKILSNISNIEFVLLELF